MKKSNRNFCLQCCEWKREIQSIQTARPTEMGSPEGWTQTEVGPRGGPEAAWPEGVRNTGTHTCGHPQTHKHTCRHVCAHYAHACGHHTRVRTHAHMGKKEKTAGSRGGGGNAREEWPERQEGEQVTQAEEGRQGGRGRGMSLGILRSCVLVERWLKGKWRKRNRRRRGRAFVLQGCCLKRSRVSLEGCVRSRREPTTAWGDGRGGREREGPAACAWEQGRGGRARACGASSDADGGAGWAAEGAGGAEGLQPPSSRGRRAPAEDAHTSQAAACLAVRGQWRAYTRAGRGVAAGCRLRPGRPGHRGGDAQDVGCEGSDAGREMRPGERVLETEGRPGRGPPGAGARCGGEPAGHRKRAGQHDRRAIPTGRPSSHGALFPAAELSSSARLGSPALSPRLWSSEFLSRRALAKLPGITTEWIKHWSQTFFSLLASDSDPRSWETQVNTTYEEQITMHCDYRAVFTLQSDYSRHSYSRARSKCNRNKKLTLISDAWRWRKTKRIFNIKKKNT